MESLGILCDLIFVACVIVAGPVFLIGGGGTWLARRGEGENGRSRAIPIAMLAVGLSWAVWLLASGSTQWKGWEKLRPGYHLGDRELEPYQHAITGIDRVSLGFSAITQDAEIKILSATNDVGSCPSAELYIPDLPAKVQYICLLRQGSWYYWHSEIEMYQGPEQLQRIWLAYSSAPDVMTSHQEPYTLVVEYEGPDDPRLPADRSLTLADVEPIIAEWRAYHLGHR